MRAVRMKAVVRALARVRRDPIRIPSRRLFRPDPPRVRLYALLAVRDDVDYLPGYIANVGPQVNGIIALDDGSTDGSAEFLEDCEEVVEVLRVPEGRPRWEEMANFSRLVEAAVRHRAQWAVGLDADERVERHFRVRLERVIARGGRLGFRAYGVRLRELWDTPDQYRVDAIWGCKERARIFRPRPGVTFDTRSLHGLKIPLEDDSRRRYAAADLEVYHLRMIHPEDRLDRRERYELADPEAVFQPTIGYSYLTDEGGASFRPVDPSRGFLPRDSV